MRDIPLALRLRAWHKTWSPQAVDKSDWHRPGQKINGMQFVKGWFFSNRHEYVNLADWASACRIEEVELMRSTGLLDKNKKEIYEGDIVRYTDYNTADRLVKVANVYWMDWADWAKVPFLHPFGSPTSGKDLKDGRSTGTHFITPPEDCEVIGNIYENLELLTA